MALSPEGTRQGAHELCAGVLGFPGDLLLVPSCQQKEKKRASWDLASTCMRSTFTIAGGLPLPQKHAHVLDIGQRHSTLHLYYTYVSLTLPITITVTVAVTSLRIKLGACTCSRTQCPSRSTSSGRCWRWFKAREPVAGLLGVGRIYSLLSWVWPEGLARRCKLGSACVGTAAALDVCCHVTV